MREFRLKPSIQSGLRTFLGVFLLAAPGPRVTQPVAWQNAGKGVSSPKAVGPTTVPELKSAIDAIVGAPQYRSAAWGVEIASLDTGKILYGHDPQRLLVPASNAKLFTAALALDRLGPDFTIRTSVYSTAPVGRRGVIKGDVIIYGRGDPTFAAGVDEDPYTPLERLAAVFQKAGVRKIEGSLIGDESDFRGGPFGSGWQWNDFQWYYGAEVSALSINDNSLKLEIFPGSKVGRPCQISTLPSTRLVTFVNQTSTAPPGSARTLGVYRGVGENVFYVWGALPRNDPGYSAFVAVHNPALLFVSMLKEVLAKHGIAVTGRVNSVDWKYREVHPLRPSRLKVLGEVTSAPLAEIVKDTLKPSQNLLAQMLLLQVGKASEGSAEGAGGSSSTQAGSSTTEQDGLAALNLFLAKAGVAGGAVFLEEGSGLSRGNLATPEAIVKLLAYSSKQKYAGSLMDALPVSAEDGTLKNRMKGTVAAGKVKAKTGTLRFDHALSGYLTTAAGESLAFSIILNNYANYDGDHPGVSDIDRIAELLAGFSGHS